MLGFGMMVFWAFSQPLLPSYSKDVLNIGGSGYAVLNGLYFAVDVWFLINYFLNCKD